MKIETASYTDIGGRKKNEDAAYCGITENGTIGILCDGLGGHVNGDVASRLAIQTVLENLKKGGLDKEQLAAVIVMANARIYNLSHGSGMSSTIAVIWTDGHRALMANVGDTRIYQFHDGTIAYQSADHSVAYVSVLTGDITVGELRTAPNRNMLTKALGVDEEIRVSVQELPVEDGDAFLLCTDGFWEYVWERDMRMTLAESDSPGQWLDRMKPIREKNAPAKCDNHSAISLFIK